MNIEACWCGLAPGSVTAITIRKSAIEPLEENHLCPLITYSFPSRSARVRGCVGSLPAVSGSVNENADLRYSASSGRSQRSFCSGVPAIARISEFPESGTWHPNAFGASEVTAASGRRGSSRTEPPARQSIRSARETMIPSGPRT
jgi:hypothetical protein